MKRLLIASLAGLALTTGAALAADLPIKSRPVAVAPPPTTSWTGCYISAGAGYGMSNLEHSGTEFFGSPTSTPTITNGGRGWLGRFGGGCDYQMMPKIVVGVFGDYDISDISGDFTGAFPIGSTFLTGTQKQSSAWAIGGRIGYLISPTLLTYFNGGYTEASFDQITLPVNPFPPNYFPSQTYSGWFLGSGFEYSFNFLPIHGLFWRTEYRYSTYDSNTLIGHGGFLGPGPNGFNETAKPYVQTVTTSLVWRFNAPGH
jgi:outer membrane immunogenic protein